MPIGYPPTKLCDFRWQVPQVGLVSVSFATLEHAQAVDADWPNKRRESDGHCHWRWTRIALQAADFCAVVGSQGTIMALWCSLAKEPLRLPSGLFYRLDYLEIAPNSRGGSLGLFVLALVASRSLEIGCDGLVLAALPEQKLCDFYVRAGGKPRRPKGWNCQSGMRPFQFDTERLRYLKELADAHVDEGE